MARLAHAAGLAGALLFPLVAGGCVSTQPAGGPASRRGDTATLRQIRVLIFEGPSAGVAVQGPCRVVDPNGRSLFADTAAISIRVAADSQQPGAVMLNDRSVPSGSRILPRTSGSIQIDGKPYGGTLTLLNRSGRLLLVSNLDIEEYLPGVLTGELFPKFHAEAFKAQAVAARTYALYQKFANPKPDYDMTSTTASQVYVGAGSDKAVEAVRATYGRVLTWTSPPARRCSARTTAAPAAGRPRRSTTCSRSADPAAGRRRRSAPAAPTPSTTPGSRSTSAARS